MTASDSASRPLTLRSDRARIKTAGKIFTLVLNTMGFAGITLPLRWIIIHPDYVGQDWLIRHELAHLAQIDRDGPLKFWPKIIFDFLWHGHQNSPYEIEARSYE